VRNQRHCLWRTNSCLNMNAKHKKQLHIVLLRYWFWQIRYNNRYNEIKYRRYRYWPIQYRLFLHYISCIRPLNCWNLGCESLLNGTCVRFQLDLLPKHLAKQGNVCIFLNSSLPALVSDQLLIEYS